MTPKGLDELILIFEGLDRCREEDPGYTRALASFVESEATLGGGDPVEGKVIKPESPSQEGTVHEDVRRILNA